MDKNKEDLDHSVEILTARDLKILKGHCLFCGVLIIENNFGFTMTNYKSRIFLCNKCFTPDMEQEFIQKTKELGHDDVFPKCNRCHKQIVGVEIESKGEKYCMECSDFIVN